MSVSQEDIALVFEMQRNRHPRERLSKDKAKLIRERLKDGYTVEDLGNAILGCHHTPHNLGDNDRKTKYLGLHVSLHSNNVSRFIEVGESVEVHKNRDTTATDEKKRLESKRFAEARNLSEEERASQVAEFQRMRKELGR